MSTTTPMRLQAFEVDGASRRESAATQIPDASRTLAAPPGEERQVHAHPLIASARYGQIETMPQSAPLSIPDSGLEPT